MNKKLLTGLGAGLCAALLLGAGASMRAKPAEDEDVKKPESPPKPPLTTRPPKPVDPALVAAYNGFGFRIFRQLRQGNKDNVLASPLSIAEALTMTANGALGPTRQEMAQTLGIEEFKLEQGNKAALALRASLSEPGAGVELSVANSLWARKDVTFKNDFLNLNRTYFGAEATSLDFTDPNTAATINAWVDKNTKGKITKIVDGPLDARTILMLINTVYFKGQWKNKFEAAATVDKDFTLENGKTKSLPMMTQTREYDYLKGENFSAVSLPYGEGRFSLYLVLPDKGVKLDSVLDTLDGAKWDGWIKQFKSKPGSVTIPRFKLDYEEELNDSLKALGMPLAFDPRRADFNGMAGPAGTAARKNLLDNIYIGKVKHKAVMEVNEEGTEAAAATSVEMRTTMSAMPEEPFTFVADRPFFAAIRDSQTGSLLFLSAVMEPK